MSNVVTFAYGCDWNGCEFDSCVSCGFIIMYRRNEHICTRYWQDFGDNTKKISFRIYLLLCFFAGICNMFDKQKSWKIPMKIRFIWRKSISMQLADTTVRCLPKRPSTQRNQILSKCTSLVSFNVKIQLKIVRCQKWKREIIKIHLLSIARSSTDRPTENNI